MKLRENTKSGSNPSDSPSCTSLLGFIFGRLPHTILLELSAVWDLVWLVMVAFCIVGFDDPTGNRLDDRQKNKKKQAGMKVWMAAILFSVNFLFRFHFNVFFFSFSWLLCFSFYFFIKLFSRLLLIYLKW